MTVSLFSDGQARMSSVGSAQTFAGGWTTLDNGRVKSDVPVGPSHFIVTGRLSHDTLALAETTEAPRRFVRVPTP
jgi:hypothetical protein